MRMLAAIFKSLKEFMMRYPAVLSGYLIYAYFFVTTMDFYRDFKRSSLDAYDIFKNFDSLVWMWLLAWVLVKVIHYRTRLNEQEKLRVENRKELEVRETQINTMHEVIRGLQHNINNPLTIILAYIRRAERIAGGQPEMIKNLSEVREAAERINRILQEYSQAKRYMTEDSPVGQYAKPDSTPTLDETGTPRG